MHLIDVGPETEVAPYVLADGEFRMKQSGITYVHDDPEVFLTWEIVSGS